MDKNKNPIGVFDSGVGGLTVLNTLLKQLPSESYVYVGDTKNCPYGTKTDDEIIALSDKIVNFLVNEKKSKLVVVACNTATSAAIAFLRKKYNVPIVGIEPAIKPASLLSKTGCIGVLATQSTVNGNHFRTTYQKYANDKTVIIKVGYGLVEQVEQNEINTPETKLLLKKYIEPMLAKNVDYIVLGCTHYPLLSEKIKEIIKGKNVALIEPSLAIAKQVKKKLKEYNLTAKTKAEQQIVKIYTTSQSISVTEAIIKQLDGFLQCKVKLGYIVL